MEKYIILLRHADAVDINDFDGGDYERPLTKKGKKQAELIAKFLKKNSQFSKIPKIISSPSKRTLKTSEIVAKNLKIKSIKTDINLYESSCSKYLKIVNSLSNRNKSVILCGHNPTISQFAAIITTSHIESLQKGSIAIISFPGALEWKNVKNRMGKLVGYIPATILK